MSRKLWLRWLFSLGIGLLLGASLVTACVIFLGKEHESVLQLSQPLSQGAGTIVMAALYFWREYIGVKSGDDGDAKRAEVSVAPVIPVTTEVTATPQIIQNIYPPSLSPPPLSQVTSTVIVPDQPVESSFVDAYSDEPPVGAERFVRAERAVLCAERFVLIDREGRERAAMMVDGKGAATLRMLDRAGRRRINLAVGADGFSELALMDAAGAARIEIGTPGDDAYAYLAIRGQRTYLLAAGGREVTETVWDEAGKRDWSAPIGPRRSEG